MSNELSANTLPNALTGGDDVNIILPRPALFGGEKVNLDGATGVASIWIKDSSTTQIERRPAIVITHKNDLAISIHLSAADTLMLAPENVNELPNVCFGEVKLTLSDNTTKYTGEFILNVRSGRTPDGAPVPTPVDPVPANFYALLKNMMVEGDNTTLTEDDVARTIAVNATPQPDQTARDAARANAGAIRAVDTRVTALENTPTELNDGEVTTDKLADRAVTRPKIGTQAVGPRELDTDSVRTGHLADASVTDPKIPNDTIKTRHIEEDTVTQGEMAANSVGTPELKNDNVTEEKLAPTVRTKLNERGTGGAGTDQTARNAAAAADAKAVAAQLDVDTVIEVGPAFIHNETGPKNISVSIRHPLNAYASATLMEVSIAGQPAVIVGYDNTVLEQDVLAEVSASTLANLWASVRDIDDGMGGTRSVQRYALGTYVDVYIRLVPGRGQTPVFLRTVDVLVIDSTPTPFTQVEYANEAAARAASVANDNVLRWWPE